MGLLSFCKELSSELSSSKQEAGNTNSNESHITSVGLLSPGELDAQHSGVI